jgi:hypothetical protein
MNKINYSIFGHHFCLLTDNAEISDFLHDALEKHIVNIPSTNASIFIRIPWMPEAKRRYLTRTAPSKDAILSEVFLSRDGIEFVSWNDTAPPLIPYQLPEIAGNYFAYHAAAVNIEGVGAAVLLGNKGAGKSTNSLALCREPGVQLLTDETCVIKKFPLLVSALLRQPHIHVGSPDTAARKTVIKFRHETWLQTAQSGHPRFAFELLYIPHLPTPHIQLAKNKLIAAQIYMRHQIYFGAPIPDGVNHSREMADAVPIYQIFHGGYGSFSKVRELIMQKTGRVHYA